MAGPAYARPASFAGAAAGYHFPRLLCVETAPA